MRSVNPSPRRNAVLFTASPGSRLWITVWVSFGLFLLALAVFYSSAELLYALRSMLLLTLYKG